MGFYTNSVKFRESGQVKQSPWISKVRESFRAYSMKLELQIILHFCLAFDHQKSLERRANIREFCGLNI